MKPAPRLLKLLSAWLFAALGLMIARIFVEDMPQTAAYAWYLVGGILLLLAIIDASTKRQIDNIGLHRKLPKSLALGIGNQVSLKINNTLARPVRCLIHDMHPGQVHVEGLPLRLNLPAGEQAEVFYQIHPIHRGDAQFGKLQLRMESPWRLWQFTRLGGDPALVQIYPNFATLVRFDTLGHDQQVGQMGIHKLQRRGQGMDFQQLREYRQGDSLRQIDWKATARQLKLVSREYQDERDQDVIFLLDCGRRMRSKDDELSHFDHALNAVLFAAHVALRQGDAVGLQTFAGDERWYAPVKGHASINTLMNQVYDLHSSTDASDYLEAAQAVMARHRKRSLVILVSNAREEDQDDLLAATRLLARHHLVMVANLREQVLDDLSAGPVNNFSQALVYSATIAQLSGRQRLMAHLKSLGVVLTDALPHQLYLSLVNEYLALKRSGRF